MNTQIKYTILDNNTKKVSVLYASLQTIEHKGLYRISGIYDYVVIDRQQNTGFHDVNGTDIYEGDTVEYKLLNDNKKTITGIIYFEDGCFIIKESKHEYKPIQQRRFLSKYVSTCKIIRDETNKSEKL